MGAISDSLSATSESVDEISMSVVASFKFMVSVIESVGNVFESVVTTATAF